MLDAKPNGRRCCDTVTDRVCRRSPLERDLKIEVKASGKAVKSERALLRVLVPPPPSKKSSQIQFGLSIMVRQARERERMDQGRAREGGGEIPADFCVDEGDREPLQREVDPASERQREG